MRLHQLHRFFFGTLRGRLILGVAAVQAAMMALFIFDLTMRQRGMLLDRQAEEAEALSQSLSTSAAGWIASADVSGLQEIVEAQRRYPELIFAVITDNQGRVLAHTDPSRRGLYLLDLPHEARQTTFSEMPTLVDVAVPAMLGGHHVGWVRVGIGQKASVLKLAEITRKGVGYALVTIFISSAIAWLMGVWITRRLYAIQKTINAVRSGNRLARSQVSGTDEAAAIAREFNDTLDALDKREAELRESQAQLSLSLDEIRNLNAELEQRVRDRTRALEAANTEMESFSYSVSHDLRAPLRAIDGFSRIVLEDCGSRLDSDSRQNLDRVRAASQRMGHLIDDLLLLSRLTRSEMRRTPVDLGALAQTVADGLQKEYPGRDVEFVIAPDLVAYADASLMRVVLENLLGNAWKFTGKQDHATIAFGRTTHDGIPAFFVRDNGVGFDMHYASKLFGAFQRLHTHTEFPGTGIGLATVQRVIHRHNGRVWAESATGHGATFYFTLPPEPKKT